MRIVRMLVPMAGIWLIVNVASAQQPSGAMDLMKSAIIPASDVVFGVGKAAPKSDQDWTAVRESAAKLNNAARLLTLEVPAEDGINWIKFSKAMGDAAKRAGEAAQAKNVDAVLDAGDALYETCTGCHKLYMKK